MIQREWLDRNVYIIRALSRAFSSFNRERNDKARNVETLGSQTFLRP